MNSIDRIEYTPEERALLARISIWVNLRWLVILGIIISTLVASYALDIGFPKTPVYIICAVIASYNLFFLLQTRRIKAEKAGIVIRKAESNGNMQILFDLVAMTVLLHYTGGIENPFVFFYLVHTTAASIVLPKRRTYELATAAIIMCALLFFLEYYEVIPHVNLEGFVLPSRYKELHRVLGVLVALIALIYACTYVSTSVAGELRRRQREIVKLGNQLIEKKNQELEQIASEVVKLAEERRRFVQFLGIVAHELRSPLVAIQGLISFILEGFTGDVTEEQRDLLERGDRRITEMLSLIDDLLDIPHIATGQIVSELQEISLNDVVKTAADGLENLATQKGIALKLELPEVLPKVNGSNRRLQQVVTNVVSNAINYTSEGTVLVRALDSGDEVRIEIMDTGIGIPSEDLPRLFEDFFRGSNVKSKGTGLGLSICKRIVEAHGGKIWAESPDPVTGMGSRISFTIPKKKTTASAVNM